MPDTATFIADIACSKCGTSALNSARFMWGGVPGPTYRIGDSIRWVRDEDGKLLEPFILFRTGDNTFHWNYGDAALRRVHLYDRDIYAGNHALACRTCGVEFAAVRAVIEEGAFAAAQAMTSSEVARDLASSMGKSFDAAVLDDGKVAPREWSDIPVPYTFRAGVRP